MHTKKHGFTAYCQQWNHFLFLAPFVISFMQFYLCTKTFTVSNLQWSSNCTKKTPESGRVFQKFLYASTLTFPIMMLLIYILIFYNMRRKRQSTSNQNKTYGIYTGHQIKARIRTSKYERSILDRKPLLPQYNLTSLTGST
ncbi:Signaling lymphocytic activation molecule [Dirofilaria immitis]